MSLALARTEITTLFAVVRDLDKVIFAYGELYSNFVGVILKRCGLYGTHLFSYGYKIVIPIKLSFRAWSRNPNNNILIADFHFLKKKSKVFAITLYFW